MTPQDRDRRIRTLMAQDGLSQADAARIVDAHQVNGQAQTLSAQLSGLAAPGTVAQPPPAVNAPDAGEQMLPGWRRDELTSMLMPPPGWGRGMPAPPGDIVPPGLRDRPQTERLPDSDGPGSRRGEPGTWRYLAYWKNDALDVDETLYKLPANDQDAAILIWMEHPGWLNHAHQSGTWHVWDGTHHMPADLDRAGRRVALYADKFQQLMEEIGHHLARECPVGSSHAEISKHKEQRLEPHQAAIRYWAGLKRTAAHSALVKMLAVICSTPESVFDEKHPRWLNCLSGTVYLVTGAQKPHDPADMLAYCVPVNWNPAAKAPRFWSLLCRVCGGDRDIAWYLLKALGYALLGANPEQKIIFLNGPTKSGKSVLLEVCAGLLGPLACPSKAELITVVRHGRNARVENSVRGARLITITETSRHMHIDEGQLKRLTGEREISVDQHYAKRTVRTPVTWLIIVATNKMPTITDFDEAVAERIIVIPCGPTIPPELRDRHLAERIIAEEAEGVLALLIKGCIEYHRSGLEMPLAVRLETERYRGEQNTVANFLADCAVIVPPTPYGQAAAVPRTQAWALYQIWAGGESHLGRNDFYDHMAAQPGVTLNDASNARIVFEGLRWNEEGRRRLDQVRDSGEDVS